MGVFLGIDVGTVSLKVAAVGDDGSLELLRTASALEDLFFRPPGD